MSTVNISLPDPMKQFVEQRVTSGSYGTVSEYIRELIRKDQKRNAEDDLERKLLDGLHSGHAGAWSKKDFDSLKANLVKRFGGKKAR